ncbi:MAG: energy transducer TonB, partial [Bacteroides sp.]
MEVKKSPKADLEGNRGMWLLVGYVMVLALLFVAFEWTQRDVKVSSDQGVADLVFEEEIIPITQQEEIQAPPPPEAPSVAEVLTIVKDDAKVEETNLATTEETGKAVAVKYVPVAVEEPEPEEQTIFQVVEN